MDLVLEMKELNTNDSVPLMEKLEKELAMLGENMASVADAFERIYAVFPDPIMDESLEKSREPDVERPDRLSQVIRGVDRINVRASRLAQKINITLDTVLGSEEARRD